MNRLWIARIINVSIVFICIVIFACEVAAINDLFEFEYAPLFALLGWSGLMTVAALNVGLLTFAMRASFRLLRRPEPMPRVATALIVATALLALWVVEWVYMEIPLTARLFASRGGAPSVVLRDAVQADFSHFSLARGVSDPSRLAAFKAMYERIRLNNVEVYSNHPIGRTIDKYANEMGVDPFLLFFGAYLVSFYGEAASGPTPFVRAMTPETIRDAVQIHLPAWFVESRIRQTLISSERISPVLGESLGFKIRYALHKATLDVSAQPYDASTFTGIFLAMKQYPDAFSDVWLATNADPLRVTLRDSFRSLQDSVLKAPYETPYAHAPLDSAYYDSKREALKQFARAAYYLNVLDFDFATRVQALLTKYVQDYYASKLGTEKWRETPRWQQAAMISMVRDVYTPNVGHLAYNLYSLPELNCTALEFVSSDAVMHRSSIGGDQQQIWRPSNYQVLWAGAGYQLRVMSEVWDAAFAKPIPGLGQTDTVAQTIDVI